MSNKVIEVKEVEEIKVFIRQLKKQIKKNLNNNNNYVLLKLKERNVNKLSELLQNEDVLKHIIDKFNKDTGYIDEKDNYWRLCITGFKHGAEKNSIRKIGLLMYKNGKTFNFKSAIFYNSAFFSKYYTFNGASYLYDDKICEQYISNIKLLMDNYLEEPKKYDSNINYIRKKSPLRKKSTYKTTVSNFVVKAIKNRNEKNENKKNEIKNNNSIN